MLNHRHFALLGKDVTLSEYADCFNRKLVCRKTSRDYEDRIIETAGEFKM